MRTEAELQCSRVAERDMTSKSAARLESHVVIVILEFTRFFAIARMGNCINTGLNLASALDVLYLGLRIVNPLLPCDLSGAGL